MWVLEDKKEIKRIENEYFSTRSTMHTCYAYEPKAVYAIEMTHMAERFSKTADEHGNIVELWHGTRLPHLLSILKNSLKLPDKRSRYFTGAMFSPDLPGLYFAPCATKSMGYTDIGMWTGGSGNSCFMFRADVVVGKSYTPRSTSDGPFPKPGYFSTWAKANYSGVMNDEVIVYTEDAVNLKYLVEFELGRKKF